MVDPDKEVTKLHMELPYSDGSGIEHGVSLDKRFDSDGFLSIIFKDGEDEAAFPTEKLDWLRGCLDRIAAEING
jgi:hypothetical protein